MFIEEIKKCCINFTSYINQLLSTHPKDGVSVYHECLYMVQALLALIIPLVLIFIWVILRKIRGNNIFSNKISRYHKNKDQRKRKKKLTKEHDLQIKREAKLQRDKEESQIIKSEEREKDLQEKISLLQEEKKKQKVLEREIEKGVVNVSNNLNEDSLIERLRKGIANTRTQLISNLSEVVLGKKEIDEELLDDLEEVLIGSDIGPETTQRILNSIIKKIERSELSNPAVLRKEIQIEIEKIMNKKYSFLKKTDRKPLILLFVGVNGVGKTTTIGKIASKYGKQGKKVLMGAGDTFRAAAIEQLEEWSKRADCHIVSKEPGSDPSAVMFETIQKGINEGYDVVICDTAGRLHNNKNLMEELKKMIRVIRKLIPDAPHEVFLVLDATTGQNAIFQTKEFLEAADLTGLIITKLDGTPKGGVIIGIVNEFDVPVRYIGIGEQIDDLRPFDSKQFTQSLFN